MSTTAEFVALHRESSLPTLSIGRIATAIAPAPPTSQRHERCPSTHLLGTSSRLGDAAHASARSGHHRVHAHHAAHR